MKRVYLDNASTTPMLPEVIETMSEIMAECYGNASSVHFHGRKARTVVEQARKIVAKTINSSIGEVFFTSSATEAHNMILDGAVHHLGVERIITSPTEHHCISHPVEHLVEDHNGELVLLDVDAQGRISYEQLEAELAKGDKKTLVSLMHANNEIGTMIDVQRVGDLCEKYGALFHCDTVQSIGKFDVDVKKNKICFCAGSAHKFHGPKGVGFVYIKNENMIAPLILGGAQERNMRAGTENVYGIAGLGKALELSIAEKEERKAKIKGLRQHLKQRMSDELEDIQFNGDQAEDRDYLYNVLNTSFPHSSKSDLLQFNLDINGISASAGSACSSGIAQQSHVLKAIGHDETRTAVRFSISHLNTMEEIDYVVDKLKTITPCK